MSSEWAGKCCEWYHNPREWEKTLAAHICELFLFGLILGHPTGAMVSFRPTRMLEKCAILTKMLKWQLTHPMVYQKGKHSRMLSSKGTPLVQYWPLYKSIILGRKWSRPTLCTSTCTPYPLVWLAWWTIWLVWPLQGTRLSRWMPCSMLRQQRNDFNLGLKMQVNVDKLACGHNSKQ